jgi:hypothetical protein
MVRLIILSLLICPSTGLVVRGANEFTTEWNRHQAAETSIQANHHAELSKIDTQLNRFVDAIADGTPAARVKERMIALENRKAQLQKELAQATAPAPRLHPNLAEVYRLIPGVF